VSWLRSWMNRKSPTEVDAATAGGLPLYLFFEQKDPFVYVFNDEVFAAWCGERPLPVECRAILKAVAAASQLLVYLRLIEGKFGHEVTRIVREHLLIVADRAPEFQLSMLLSKVEDVIRREGQFEDWLRGEPIARRVAVAALVTIPESPYLRSAEKSSSTRAELALPPEEVIGALIDLVLNATRDAERVFGPVVSALILQPESIKGLWASNNSADLVPTIGERIQWSQNPGHFERYLQIRHNNPLFPPERRKVEPRELFAARKQDTEEREDFQAQMKSYLDEIVSVFHPTQPAAYAQCDEYRVKLEALIERASELGPSVEQDRATLWKLWHCTVQDIEKSVALWEFDADKALDAASAAHRLAKERLIRFGNFAIAQMIRDDGPVPKEERAPFILSHDADTILQFMSFYKSEAKAEFRSYAEALFRNAQAKGFEIPDTEEKLKAMSDHS
jgi:hypothetical protein